MIRRAWAFLRSAFPLLVVLTAFIGSATAIALRRHHRAPPADGIVLRIAHWQLELGVRDGIAALAAAYERLHPNVKIEQLPIPESTYSQFVTTQLMGGTAPDMIQAGMVPYNVMLGYYARYLVPLTAAAKLPNPYNAGTDLADTPWLQTYKDGMRNSYIGELQEYMTVPLTQFGIRIFYNRDLLKRLTGLEVAPQTFRDFLAACERIRAQTDPQGRPYVPIAGSAYHVGMWATFMCEPLTFGAVRRVDFNRDGAAGNDEFFAAVMTGRIDFDFPGYAARFQMLSALTQHFQAGFTGLGRDEAVFLFAQQRAVFMTTGTWDAGSLREQARDSFEIGIMDFPQPGKDDPEFGSVLEGPVYELPSAEFQFAIARTCKHPDVALDFLQFVASQRGNEELNRIIGWIPAIEGTQMAPMLEAFKPHLEGVFGAMPITLGGETNIKWQQLTSLFQVNQISYADLIAEFGPFYRQQGPAEYAEMRRNSRRAIVGDEQVIAGARAAARAATGTDAVTRWMNYRSLVAGRLVTRDFVAANLDRVIAAGPAPDAPAPYDFPPTVIDRVRARLTGHGQEDP
ncbi:MAG: extracellular solute-binding protein [Verrucomicrobia bacterium]|nr:extracellular solute-binding protein [Verrucomicrobiota bacterium]